MPYLVNQLTWLVCSGQTGRGDHVEWWKGACPAYLTVSNWLNPWSTFIQYLIYLFNRVAFYMVFQELKIYKNYLWKRNIIEKLCRPIKW